MKNNHRENSIQALSEAKTILKELKEDPNTVALKQIEELEYWGIELDILQYPEHQDLIKHIKKQSPNITNEDLIKEIKSCLTQT